MAAKKHGDSLMAEATAEIERLRRQVENQTRVNGIALRDANFTAGVISALFDIAAAAEKLIEARMPRGASYLLSALQTIQSEFEEQRMQAAAGLQASEESKK